MKLALNGFTSYTETDGLDGTRIASIIENQSGQLCVISNISINRFDGGRFTGFLPAVPRDITYIGWGWYQTIFPGPSRGVVGDYGAGVLRYPRSTLEELTRARPKNIYTTRDGLRGNDIFRLFEDSHGDIWISSVGRPGAGIAKWVRSTETIRPYTTADGIRILRRARFAKIAPAICGSDSTTGVFRALQRDASRLSRRLTDCLPGLSGVCFPIARGGCGRRPGTEESRA
jgi:hypothetical protein